VRRSSGPRARVQTPSPSPFPPRLPPPPTLAAALAPYAVPAARLTAYAPHLSLQRRVTGAPPPLLLLLALSPAALHTAMGLFGRMVGCWAVDFRLGGTLSPHHRWLVWAVAAGA